MRYPLARCGLLALPLVAAQPSLPYNPTRILRPQDASFAYVLQPIQGSKGQVQLSYIDLTSSFATSSGSLTTLTSTLPFLQDDKLVPYTAVVDANANITAVTGDCSQGIGGAQVWQYTSSSPSTSGTWTQYQTLQKTTQTQGELAGSNFLANGVAFSQFTASDSSDTTMYLFGGMCPFDNSTADTWTSAASYSNLMLSFSPSDSEMGTTQFNVDLALSRGPPIAEAGFSMTPLAPTFSANSSGQPQTQQQDFVLLGGQTDTAFINMSQVALWSLPQQGWTFFPVSQSSSAKADLAVRQSPGVEPRSGHTAVLSDDGTTIYVIGGWVGDVNTPASPQVATLNVGEGYGGNGVWSWSTPTQPSSLPFGTGIYGHGAAMLPGGVVMLAGGYTTSGSAKIKRDPKANTGFYLYNTTSNSWIDTYVPPTSSGSESHSGPLDKASQQAGLGAGLGVGCAVVIGLFAFYMWYSKRLKNARDQRRHELLTRSSHTSFNNTDRAMLENGGVVEQNDAPALGRFWNAWENRGYGQVPSGRPTISAPIQSMRGAVASTGLFVDVPSPTRGLRKAGGPRPYQYHAAPRWDEPRSANRRSGIIHPIAELENEDGVETPTAAQNHEMLSDAEKKLRELERVLGSPNLDPFTDPNMTPNPLRSHPITPETTSPTGPVNQRSAEIRRKPVPSVMFTDAEIASNWLSLGHSEESPWDTTGRESPTKTDERTSSTLSERSQRSVASTHSYSRTMSGTTGALLAAAAAARPTTGRSEQSDSASPPNKSPYHTRARSSTNGSMQEGQQHSSGASDTDSFTTAGTNFHKLQTEGQNLLGQRSGTNRQSGRRRKDEENEEPQQDDEFPFTRPRKRGWMGSLRKALNAVAMGDRSLSFTSNGENLNDAANTASSSPIKDRAEESFSQRPRRTVSDGGALLAQKRGQRDWEDNDNVPRYRDNPEQNDWGEPKRTNSGRQAEEEWDVEGAVSKRDVQVMFSVPKARLRVVNADMDRVSLRSTSDSALSRSESMKRREEFSRNENERSILDTTVEEHFDEGWDEKWKAA